MLALDFGVERIERIERNGRVASSLRKASVPAVFGSAHGTTVDDTTTGTRVVEIHALSIVDSIPQ